ncbi:hypothetical protein [Aquimarina sediminis]|uniref:hypothetical protein n=1 Tax=Aquimarina sediminis TaxID=2070536 RepID=UPI000CA02E43|nr:hypothetical protein [Aquimarina sediminis]
MLKLKSLLAKYKLSILNGGKYPILTKISADYKNKHEILHYPFDYKGCMQEEVGKHIADIYESIEHKPNDELVKEAYKQLEIELIKQFEFVKKRTDIKFEPYTGEGEPYSNSYEMLVDINNHHLYFFKTASGFGETEYNEVNIMLKKTGVKIGKYELVVNDLFRIVHDIFGHAMNGNGFGPIGEDNAWYDHLQMFSPLAASALSTETRGQNCWVNFGLHLRDKNNQLLKKGQKGWIQPSERPFAYQKMNILPSYITGIEVYKDVGRVKAKYVNFWDPFLSILNS